MKNKCQGEPKSDANEIIQTASIELIKIYICLVCGENMGDEKYACKNLREARDLKCINAGYKD